MAEPTQGIKNKEPLFSIITVTYNAASTVGRTIDSVDCQTFGDYEHMIVDGASRDRTLDIVTSGCNPRRRWLSEADRGIYDAMNKGISSTTGKYLIFLNSGDKFHSPEVLSKIAAAIREHNDPGIVYGQTNIVDENGQFLYPRHHTAPEKLTLRSFASGMLVCHQAFIALRKVTGFYNVSYRFSADYDWCIQCLQHSRCNVGLTSEVLVDYLSGGMTDKNRRKSLVERFRIMSYYYGFMPTLWRHVGFFFRWRKRKAQGRE